MPEKQALNSQKGLFYPVSQQSLNEIGDIFLCVCEVFRGKFRNDLLRGDILLLTYIELRLFRVTYLCRKKCTSEPCLHLCLHKWLLKDPVRTQLVAQVAYLLLT